MEDTNWAFSKKFTEQFHTSNSELEARLEAAKKHPTISAEALQDISLSISKLSRSLADATGSLPSYDQRLYENQIKALEVALDALRSASLAKPKFSFRRKPQEPKPSDPGLPPPAITANSKEPDLATVPSNGFVLASHKRRYLTRSALPAHADQSDLSIHDLENCLVDLLPSSQEVVVSLGEKPFAISALHARDLKNCILLLPDIPGSALLHDLENCIIVLGSHQFRMHTSRKVDVVISINSNPIIEDCQDIRFASYPDAFDLTPSYHLQTSPTIAVQDFSHIRASPSPNFSIMDNNSRQEILERLLSARTASTTRNDGASDLEGAWP